MKTIAHLSDLHFGRVDPRVADQLAEELAADPPSLVVVSGDFTQRARPGEYAAAKAYLSRLPTPQLVVPGNHDVPLWAVWNRLIDPLGDYRRFITTDLDPLYVDGEMAVLGVNTARSLTWKGGRISTEQIAHLGITLGTLPDTLVKIVVTHHPFLPPPDRADEAVVGRAELALNTLGRVGVDLLLAGHLHRGYSGDVRLRHPTATRAMISVQAGTATSTRTRHEPNAYNRITVEPDRITVTIRTWTGTAFTDGTRTTYRRTPGGDWAADR